MKYSIKDIFQLLDEQPSFYGNPSFGGTGNYGHGGRKQLSAIRPNQATQDIIDQEEQELDQNVDDMNWRLGKYDLGGNPLGNLPGPENPKKTEFQGGPPMNKALEEQPAFDNSVSRQRDLPGFPKMNTLINPKQHVPVDKNEEDNVDYIGPTLNGKEFDYKEIGIALGECKADDEEDELEDLLGPLSKEAEADEDMEKFIYFYSDPKNKEKKMPSLEEILGNPYVTYPNKKGWNNFQINSLTVRRNHIDPQADPLDTWHGMFREPTGGHNPPSYNLSTPKIAKDSPNMGWGVVGWPKQFVPADYEQETINKSMNADIEDKDELGSKRLQQPPQGTEPRVGVNASIREEQQELLKALISEIFDEAFKSQAQRGFFYWKAGQGGKEGKKWKKWTKEFEKKTPKEKLPKRVEEIMTPEGETDLGGTQAFIKSRGRIKKELAR